MSHKGKVAKVRTECKGYGKIHGFSCANGMFGCNHAGSSVLVMAYLGNLLVRKAPLPPLPFGICCQNPPQTGVEEVRDLLAQVTGTTPCMLPCGIPDPEEVTNPTSKQSEMVNSKCCCIIQ